jgi:hypothetical protein
MPKAVLFILINLLASALFAQNENLSQGQYFDGEPYLAIDPHDPDHIVVAWIGFTVGTTTGIKVKASFDRGNSWSASTFLPHVQPVFHSADPSIAFDTAGHVFACYIDFLQPVDTGGVYMVASPDGGLTWGTPSKVMDSRDDGLKLPLDRPWFRINPVTNHFYVTTKPAPWIPAPNRAYFRTSSDEGQTWAPWRYIDTTGYLIGADISGPMITPAVGSDGIFHAMYPSYVSSQNLYPGFIHASSADDGASFSYHGAYYTHTPTPAGDSLAKVGYHLEVDPTNPLHLAFNFLNNTYGDLDVYTIQSMDGGSTWTSPVRVNDDPVGNGKMQDMSWCSFDLNGDLIVGWRDRRDAPGTGYQQPSEIWGAILRHDSAAYTPNFEISDTLAQFVAEYLDTSGNDFMNIAMQRDTMYAVWGDVRTGVLQIWYDTRYMGGAAASTGILLTDAAIPAVYIHPSPAHDMLYLSGEKVTAVSITDMSGRVVKEEMTASQQVGISSLATGAYTIRLTTGSGSAIHRFVKE